MVYQIDHATAASTVQTPTPVGTPGFWKNRDAITGYGTYEDATWFNMVQGEFVSACAALGISPTKLDSGGVLIVNQLIAAIKRAAAANASLFNASATLTPDAAGLVFVDASAGPVTLTLPHANSAGTTPIRLIFHRVDTSTNTVTLAVTSPDVFMPIAAAHTLLPGAELRCITDGSNQWFIELPGVMATNGWARLGPLLVQWGQGITVSGKLDPVTFPVPFPTACFTVQVTERNGAGWQPGSAPPLPTLYSASTASTTGFQVSGVDLHQDGTLSYVGGIAYTWFARGA